jgi:hypothetical protein
MVRIKYVDYDRLPGMKKVWWYQYGERFTRQIENFLHMQFARETGQRLQGALRSVGIFFERRL